MARNGGEVAAVYGFLKSLASRRWLIANEPAIRRILAQLHRGSRFECNVCGARLSRFIRTHDDQLCPACGSLARNRRVFNLLADELRPGLTVLEFSPSRALYRRMKQWPGIRYVATDYAGEFIAEERYDITAIAAPDASFDLIVCFHVLEHVEDDGAAMRELHRVLRPGGRCLIQTPFKDGDIHEDPTVSSPEDRRRVFGQEDHVRNYSAEGLAGRLRAAGFSVETRKFTESPGNRHGFAKLEAILVAEKRPV